MKYILLSALILSFVRSPAQPGIPVFRQVAHPLMPAITSDYIFFSADGLMWFSTSNGLTSFDGSDMVNHSTPGESNRLGLGRIFSIAEDAKENFYIGTPNGLIYFDRSAGSFSAFPFRYKDTGKPCNLSFSAIYVDKNGSVFAGSGEGGMFIIDPVTGSARHLNLDTAKPDSWRDRRYNTVCSFASHFSDPNLLWVGTYHGIYLLDKAKGRLSQPFEIVTPRHNKYMREFEHDRRMIDVQRMEPAGDSIIWFNSWAGGFARYDTRSGKADIVFGREALYKGKDVYYGYIIPGFAKLKDGKFLVGIHNGRNAVYDPDLGTATYFNVTTNDYSEEETRYVGSDRHGNTWLLQRGMLYTSVPPDRRMTSLRFNYDTKYQVAMPMLRGVVYDSAKHNYYFGFLGSSGVYRCDSSFQVQRVIPTSLINNYYNFGSTVDSRMAKDGAGRIWAVGWKVHVLLPGSPRFKPVENLFPLLARFGSDNLFSDIVSTKAGDILLKEQNGDVYRINHRTLEVDTFKCPENDDASAEIRQSSLGYDPSRDVAYLARNARMTQLDLGTGKASPLSYSELFGRHDMDPGVSFSSLDSDGRIWIMIPNAGIRILDPSTLRCVDSVTFGERGILPGDFTSMAGGPGHYMVFQSRSGIVVYDYRKEQSFLFDQSNGLSSPISKSFLTGNGYVFIGQGNGIVDYFRISSLAGYKATISPYLTSIVADTQIVYVRNDLVKEPEITLSHLQNNLTFSLSAGEFLFPDRIEYAYMLTPIENSWHYTDFFNRKLIYSNLPAGDYVFHLKAQMRGGNWKAEERLYSLSISPAWWQTVWFRILAIGALVALAGLAIQRRMTMIREKEKEKLGHEKAMMEMEAKALRAQMNPHFIFNSLNSIKSLINKGDNDAAAKYLTTFSKLIRTLFQNADKREISLYEEVETCSLYAALEKMRVGSKVNFIFDISPQLDLKDIRVPALILQPFIENALWHGLVPKEAGGTIRISITGTQEKVVCSIDDDGIGRELAARYKAQYQATHQSKGIGLTQARLDLDRILSEREGIIQIIDKHDSDGRATGTTVIITFTEAI